MSTRTFFIKTWNDEKPKFRRMIAALPPDRLDYRPHPRSNSAAGLAWQIAEEFRVLAETIDTGELRWVGGKVPGTLEDLLAQWDHAAAQVDRAVVTLDDAKWTREAKYFIHGNYFRSSTIEATLWDFLFDLIHHRGQLSTYIRPMGGKVPGTYGPSADES